MIERTHSKVCLSTSLYHHLHLDGAMKDLPKKVRSQDWVVPHGQSLLLEEAIRQDPSKLRHSFLDLISIQCNDG